MKAHLIILNIFKISNINYKRHTYNVLHNKFIQDMESCWLDGTDELDYWLLLRLLSSYRSFGSRFWRGRSQKWVSTLCRVFLLMRLLAALEVKHLYCPVKRKWLQSHVANFRTCTAGVGNTFGWVFSKCSFSVWGKLTPLSLSNCLFLSCRLSTTIRTSAKSPPKWVEATQKGYPFSFILALDGRESVCCAIWVFCNSTLGIKPMLGVGGGVGCVCCKMVK